MSITEDDLFAVVEGLSAVLPFAKQQNDASALLIWASFPAEAKEQLTPAMLVYAATQRLLDPNPPKEVALHVQLLRYVYRLENDQPRLDWGLKTDLPERMANASRFHEAPTPPYLLPAVDCDAISPGGALVQIGWQP